LVIKKIRKKRLISIIFIVLLISSSIYHIILAETQDDNDPQNDTPIIDLFRILQIDFEPPELIQDCGSMFFLNVNVTKIKFVHFPLFFSISIFLKTEDDYGRSNIILIGSQPFVFLPHYQQSKTLSIQCFTNKDLTNNLYRLYSNDKCQLDISKGSIGVRIERRSRWAMEWFFGFLGKQSNRQEIWDLLMNCLWYKINSCLVDTSQKDDGAILEMTVNNDFLTNLRFKNLLRFIYWFRIRRSNLININRFIVWKDVNLIQPFVCSQDIHPSNVVIDKETDSEGNFTVNLTIVNNLNFKVKYRGDVDILETPFINTFIPSIKSKFYSSGFFRNEIPANSFITEHVRCSFPKDQVFFKKNYIIKVECAPYLPIEDTNQFGFFFFDLRWKTFLEPKYYVNETVTNSIRKMWYNAPIFYGDPGSMEIFPSHAGKILYNGTIPNDVVEVTIKKFSDEVKNWIFLYFFFTLLLIGFFCIGYWIVRKKS